MPQQIEEQRIEVLLLVSDFVGQKDPTSSIPGSASHQALQRVLRIAKTAPNQEMLFSQMSSVFKQFKLSEDNQQELTWAVKNQLNL